jgi:para-aminobenzoate synthetase component 1
MQIIHELEQRGRGAYCGAIGFVSDSGHARFNVGIRTATITGDRLDFDVGAGVVAESDPALEWHETMVKAGVIQSLASAP